MLNEEKTLLNSFIKSSLNGQKVNLTSFYSSHKVNLADVEWKQRYCAIGVYLRFTC